MTVGLSLGIYFSVLGLQRENPTDSLLWCFCFPFPVLCLRGESLVTQWHLEEQLNLELKIRPRSVLKIQQIDTVSLVSRLCFHSVVSFAGKSFIIEYSPIVCFCFGCHGQNTSVKDNVMALFWLSVICLNLSQIYFELNFICGIR